MRSSGLYVISTAALLVMASCAGRPAPADRANARGIHRYPFKHSGWGIEIDFPHPWQFKSGAHPFLFCGPATDWPFLGGYRFLMTAHPLKNRREMIGKYDGLKSGGISEAVQDWLNGKIGRELWDVSGSMNEKVEVLRTEQLGRWTIVTLKKTHPQAQCPGMVYRIIGSRFHYDLRYPDCGAKPLFHEETRKHMVDIVHRMREL